MTVLRPRRIDLVLRVSGEPCIASRDGLPFAVSDHLLEAEMRFFGIDVGSQSHVVAMVDEDLHILDEVTDCLVVMEATGHYGRNLHRTLAGWVHRLAFDDRRIVCDSSHLLGVPGPRSPSAPTSRGPAA